MPAVQASVARSRFRRGLLGVGSLLVLLVAACGDSSDPVRVEDGADSPDADPAEPDAPVAEASDATEGGPATTDAGAAVDGSAEASADAPATSVEAGTALVTLGGEVYEFTLDVGCIASGDSIVFSGRASDGRLIGISASLHSPGAHMDPDVSIDDQQEDRDARESWRVNEHHPQSEVHSLTIAGKTVAADVTFQRSSAVMDPLDGVAEGTLEAACP